jgi:cytochrome P450
MERVFATLDWLARIDWVAGPIMDRASGIAFIVGVFATLYFTAKFVKQCIMLRKFSGPLAIPFIGNCYTKDAMFLMKYLSGLRKRYGKHFTFFAFTKPYIVVCDPSSVRRILSDNKVFVKGTDYTEQFSVAFGEGLVTSNGEKHRKDRSNFNKMFVKTNIAKYMQMMNEKTDEAIDEMVAPKVNGTDAGEKGKALDIEDFFAILSLRVFTKFALGTDMPGTEQWTAKQVSDGSWAVGRMITLGLPMWNIFPAVHTIRKSRVTLWKLLKPVVEERKRNPLPEGENADCLSVMIEEKMDDEEVNDHLVTLLSAGHDTTAYFSAYLIYLLAVHQDAQDRLRAEIMKQLNGRSEVVADDVVEMKFFNCVMQETMRLYSIIPCVTRACRQSTHIKENGVTIPAGANVLIPMFLINRDPELWDEPSKFKPERFEASTGFFTNAKNGYFPFGYGARTCIGNTLAQMESCVFIAKLLLRYDVNEDIGFKPAIFAGISLTTSNGINVRLKERI